MRRYIATVSIVLGLLGCNAFDEKGSEGGSKLFIPTDVRPVQQALTAPPPITGGTLAVSPDGQYAIAADPDRNRISVVTLATRDVRHVALEPGDEPGRVAVDDDGYAYVGLRRGGAVARIELATAALHSRTRVCPSPRGLAYDGARELLHVACADGRLVSLDAQGATARSVDLQTDLRDVMVRDDELLVSTYKGAQMLTVDAQGAVRERIQPSKVGMTVQKTSGNPALAERRVLSPNLAWRSVQSSDGSVLMLHQNAAENMVDIDKEPTPESSSSYGGGDSGFGCDGIVQSTVSDVSAGRAGSMAIAGGVLAVDMARSPRDGAIAVALPGMREFDAPRPTVVFDGDEGGGLSVPMVGPVAIGGPGQGGQVFYYDSGSLSSAMGGALVGEDGAAEIPCVFPQGLPVEGQPTAVAFAPNGDLLVQSREPALLMRLPTPNNPAGERFDLGGESVRDTGHDVFHKDAGAGIACASCHGEGGDDGHTWLFSGIGARRTQAVNVGLEGTAPFHWDGDLRDLGVLMEEVFVGRMGGVHQSDDRMGALSGWLFAQRPPTPIVAVDDPAAERGKALFHSAEVACASCHAGAQLTDNRSYDVGTSEHAGDKLQVPSLRGVGYRAPFIHNGCAETLRDRFDPSCGGGKAHGNTGHLDDAQVGDLIAYLRSL